MVGRLRKVVRGQFTGGEKDMQILKATCHNAMWSVAQVQGVGQLMHHRAQVCAVTRSPGAPVDTENKH